jgi:hypothetical protein
VARLAIPSQGVRQIARLMTEGPGPISRPGSLPAPHVACRCSLVGFDRQEEPIIALCLTLLLYEFDCINLLDCNFIVK